MAIKLVMQLTPWHSTGLSAWCIKEDTTHCRNERHSNFTLQRKWREDTSPPRPVDEGTCRIRGREALLGDTALA